MSAGVALVTAECYRHTLTLAEAKAAIALLADNRRARPRLSRCGCSHRNNSLFFH